MSETKASFFQSKKAFIAKAYRFCTHGVWDVEEGGRLSDIVKAANLAVKCFTNQEVQERACSLTYRTVLAAVPALAMLFAIARGFGFQNLVHGQLMEYFPSQRQALESAVGFVDSYLAHASEGAFVGIGLVMLLYTLVMLISSVERAFNKVWGIENGRPMYRKVTDYTALFLFIPVLIVCSTGLSILMSGMVQDALPVMFSPLLSLLLDVVPVVLMWLVFTLAFWLLPHTKVKFRYALISGIVFGTLFFLVQWVFVEGQMLVSGYNAIYGSFAFLPLLLFWMQISWMLVLMGAVMTYSLQNIYGFNYTHHDDVETISSAYLDEVSIMALAVIAKRFEQAEPPLEKADLAGDTYRIPIVLVNRIIDRLLKAELISEVKTAKGTEAYQPAFATEQMTLKEVRHRLSTLGSNRFLTVADQQFARSYSIMAQADDGIAVSQLLK
ncbi:MAG: YihY/virulence factor BrkB family protein [Bacteroidales bacterium]|nr:YihY/virulence factor BrkB family protein [Bacteroidales bacterium]